MERLTEKIGNTNCVKGCGSNCKYGFQHCRTEDWENCKTIDDVINKLAEYEGLEEQGRLIKLPCKVGDTVYVDSKTIPTMNMDFEEVKEVPLYFKANVVSFRQNCKRNYIKLKIKAKWLHVWVDPDTGLDSDYYEVEKYFTYPLSAIGKTVFLTQSEAEQKLKEMESD